MASAIGVRSVRCPKCDKLLTEFAQVPIYRCGGCTTLLRVKAHVSVGAIPSLENVSTNPASESANGEEEEVAQPDHRRASSSNAAHDDIIKSTSLAYVVGSASSPGGNERHEARAPHKRPPVSKRSCRHNKAFSTGDFRSVQNWVGSTALSKDPPFRGSSPDRSEPDPLEILRKVDELRRELGELLSRTREGRRADPLPEKKQPAVKRYCRPVCGGAPFVVCHGCWKLLRLPADFLVPTSGRTLQHKLRCGACSEVLVFSFRPRVLRRGRSESSSSEPEPEPVHNVSRSSSYSAKKLHRLMGYSSAGDVMFRSCGHVDGGYESSETSTPPGVERRRYGAGASTSESAEVQEEGFCLKKGARESIRHG